MRIVLLFLMVSSMAFSQQVLKGKVVLDVPTMNKVYIVNYSNKKETVANEQGYFKILAQPKDTLIVSGINIKGRQIILKSNDFSEDLFFVKLKQLPYFLDEVIVQNYPRINAVDLGIISSSTKTYTPAERKLKAASGLALTGNTDGTTGGSFGLDPLFNALSGRTAMLEKELEVEIKEKLQRKLEQLFSEKFYTETLKLPEEYIKGFVIYVLDDQNLMRLLQAKKSKLVENLLKEKVMQYLQIINASE
ncbi:hypothetical protein [Flavobacterium sp. GCM10023249]|uniref:hypothetical protein n=1 Tax=unclassified Flavobacterium TaxID=196869 RepID=UPI00360DD853